ncbi:hypothetical protein [Rhodococcus sp. NPDC047139]|uniref:hypothetical protein n=1 Tax=Rhodococcus sp. NPDC047139 TaxID=3155141 RepID=UPI0033F92F14
MTSLDPTASVMPEDRSAAGYGPVRKVLRRWPSLVAAALAAFVLADGGTDFPAILTGAALVYLGAAVLGRRGMAWPLFLGTVVMIGLGKFAVTAFDLPIEITLLMVALGVAGAVYGLARTAAGRAMIVGPSAVAMLGFGAVAAAAVLATPVPAGIVVGLGLLGHAAWDCAHFRRNTVVARSLAEFCGVLDTLLGIAVIVLVAVGTLS